MTARVRAVRVELNVNLEYRLGVGLRLESSLPLEGEHVVDCTHGRDVRLYEDLEIVSILEKTRHRSGRIIENVCGTVPSR